MKWVIYEIKDESCCRKWRYETDCETKEEALRRMYDGELEPTDEGSYGDSELNDSSRVVREDTEPAAWHEAFDRLCGTFGDEVTPFVGLEEVK